MARRSAALHIAGLCEYEASDAWTKILIRKLREPTLPGYARVSLGQCYRAEQELWLRVSCSTGLGRNKRGYERSVYHIDDVPSSNTNIIWLKFHFFGKVSSTRRGREDEEEACREGQADRSAAEKTQEGQRKVFR